MGHIKYHPVTSREWRELKDRISTLECVVGVNTTEPKFEDVQSFCRNMLKEAEAATSSLGVFG